MLEKMKTAFSNLSIIAANYLPKGFKDALLEMAHRNDLHAQEIAAIRQELASLTAIIHPSN
mgnify:CR=1 FL=1